MPEARLQRTRDNYQPKAIDCFHLYDFIPSTNIWFCAKCGNIASVAEMHNRSLRSKELFGSPTV